MRGNGIRLVISLVLCQMAGVFGSIFNIRSLKTWYPSLVKPSFNPPSWVFAPVWILLFFLMGVALFRIWRLGWTTPGVRTAMSLFFLQLVLNVAWSGLFFGLRQPAWAFVEIWVLWGLILVCILLFRDLDRISAWLMVPYLGWVSFAAILNGAIAWLNR